MALPRRAGGREQHLAAGLAGSAGGDHDLAGEPPGADQGAVLDVPAVKKRGEADGPAAPAGPGARRQTAAHAQEISLVTGVGPGARLTAHSSPPGRSSRLASATATQASPALSRSNT
ncbi:MAG TPA: hypothetical protein VMV17_00225 [Streptosporangiaceae bacterium]|nr:hypothetical protein [Streptosporangiaceae bacterium]